jgi:hypothetical protein
MTHIAIAEELDGKVVDWIEHVTDERFLATTPERRLYTSTV